jgi:uncharacterized protein
MLDNWLSLPVGMVIATVVSTVGIGGGILWMPFLLIILHLRPDTAVVTSLIIQAAGMGSGTFAFFRQKRIDPALVSIFLILTVPGIALGAFLTRLVPPLYLQLSLGLLTLLTAFIFVSSNQKYLQNGRTRAVTKKVWRSSWFVSIMAVASGMLSISLGEWLVPLMRSKLSLRMNVAVATSVATILCTCILGAMFHLLMGARADWTVIMWAAPGVIIGGQIGPLLTERINDRILKEIFIFLLTLIGIHLIFNFY